MQGSVIGGDVHAHISVFDWDSKQTYSTVKAAGRLHQEKVARGELGVKSGRGFLRWTPEKAQEVRARRDAFLMQFLRWQKEGRVP